MLSFDLFVTQGVKATIPHHPVQVGLYRLFYFCGLSPVPECDKGILHNFFSLIAIMQKGVGVCTKGAVIGLEKHLKSGFASILKGGKYLFIAEFHC